ncbi:ELMO/CED-12 family-domain-containing protein [Rhizopus microsporus]
MGWVILFLLNRVYQSPILLSLYKWFKCIYGQVSYTTEISRLLYTPLSPFKLYRIDKSISYSNVLMEENFQLKESNCDIDSIKDSIIQKKRVPVDLQVNLLNALQVIYASNQLLNSINDSISTKYDSNNKEHEDKLLQLWSKLIPNKPLQSRITKQWVEIGFQGNDPATDFRGMGIQGLNDLLFFAEHYPAHARSILEHANDPLQWYPFAIVGINITKFNYQLVESKKLQLYLFEYGTDELLDVYRNGI